MCSFIGLYFPEKSFHARTSYPGLNGHRYKPADVSEQFPTEDNSSSSNWPQKISTFFLLIAVIFFVAISVVYIVGMKQWSLADVLSQVSPDIQETTNRISTDSKFYFTTYALFH